MNYAFKVDGAWVEVAGETALPIAGGRQARISPTWAASLTPDVRANFGLVEVVEAVTVPAGEVLTGTSIEDVDGVPTRVAATAEIPLVELKAATVEAVRARRWTVETGGIVRNAALLKTDERTQNRVDAALKLFDEAPQLEAVDWEVAPGVFATMDRDTVKAIGVAIGLHIQACFSHSKTLCAAVAAAADAAAVLAVDIETGWPD